MRIKTKVTLGVMFLFVLMLAIGGLGMYYLNSLSEDSENILVANYESLGFTKRVIESCDSLEIDSAAAIRAIEFSIQQQELNVTERGERELTRDLRAAFEKMKNSGIDSRGIVRLRQLSLAIQELNMEAIIRKNTATERTIEKAAMYLVIMGTICAISAFTFIVTFPGYVANPIEQLTHSIKSIANKNYEERLHFDRKDEFEELAVAFNQMAEKLDEYEHSNLAKILFEKKRIETIINRMTDPVIGLDENRKVVFANDPSLNLLNVNATDIIGRYAPDVAVNNDLFRSLIQENGQNGKSAALVKAVVEGKENYYSKDVIAIGYTPTGEKGSVMIGQVILLKNITSFKELDQAKTNFIATISHELKTPIASLQMGVKLLQDERVGKLNGEQQNISRTLSDELTRLSKITNELLDLSQVETGNIKLDIRTADPQEIILRAREAVEFQAERKHVEVVLEAMKEDCTVLADLEKTTWVLVNFLTNAIRYSPENGRVVVRCTFENQAASFSVEDHGPGIEARYISRIFEKFYQVPGTPSGTGLGLAISKEFIEAQGGSIAVMSEPGTGSKFTFTLPASKANA